MKLKRILIMVMACTIALSATACKSRKGPVGSKTNPIQFYFMPLKGKMVFLENAPKLKKYLEETTGLSINAVESPDFLSIIKAFNGKHADIAFINTLGYLMARDWSKAEAPLKSVYGDIYTTYRGEILTRVDRNINTLADLAGKTIAFADPFSASGYLYPLQLLNEKKVKPAKTVFAGGHKKAVEMVYNGEVDAAATYHSRPGGSGGERDARAELVVEHPDIFAQVKIIALTKEIPNGPVAVSKDLPKDVKDKLVAALMAFAGTAEGRMTLSNIYNMTGLTKGSSSDYDSVQKVIQSLGKSVEEVVPGGVTFYEKTITPMIRD